MNTMETGKDNALNARPIGLHEAVDRWGADFSDWPDIGLVRRAREALLSDRLFRAHRDAALAGEQRLRAASAALDKRIEDRGSIKRIAANVLAQVEPRPIHWHRRIAAVAAVMVVSCLLGSVVELVSSTGDGAPVQVVQLDPLMFGPADY